MNALPLPPPETVTSAISWLQPLSTYAWNSIVPRNPALGNRNVASAESEIIAGISAAASELGGETERVLSLVREDVEFVVTLNPANRSPPSKSAHRSSVPAGWSAAQNAPVPEPTQPP